MPKSPVSLTLTSCCTLLTVSHLTCPVPLDRTQIQLTRKHRVTYLGNSQHTYIGARGGGTISRSQESSNDAADALSEYSPVNLNKMVKYLFCKTLRKKKISSRPTCWWHVLAGLWPQTDERRRNNHRWTRRYQPWWRSAFPAPRQAWQLANPTGLSEIAHNQQSYLYNA